MKSGGPLQVVRAGLLGASFDPKMVNELLEAYTEAKRSFYAGGLRLGEVEGGRFCEAALRLLQQAAKLPMTPLGQSVKTEDLIKNLSLLPTGTAPDAVRLHIPRALRMVYDIRSKRDAAHLGDGIDPNVQDATLVTTVLDWVLAEFVRLYHNVSAASSQALVENLVTRRPPVVQAFGDYLKVLNPNLSASDHVLLLLYHRGSEGASLDDLTKWVKPSMRKNLGRTIDRLENDKAFVHGNDGHILITQAGIAEVERRRLIVLPE